MLNNIYRNIILIISMIFAISACVYYPKKVEFYDHDCEIQAKKLVLENEFLWLNFGCQNEKGCLVILLITGVTGVATAIVSGSIVVVGNVIYWLEKRGKCLP